MRFSLSKLSGIFLILFLSPVVTAEQITFEINFVEPQLTIDSQGFTHVQMENGLNVGTPGQPALPSVGINVLLPPEHEVVSLDVLAAERIELYGDHLVYPQQKPRPLSKKPGVFTPPTSKIYQSYQNYPEKTYGRVLAQRMRGVDIQPLVLKPVIYKPLAGKLYWIPQMIVTLQTRPKSDANQTKQAIGFRGQKEDLDLLHSLAVNPKMLKAYNSRSPIADDAQYLIITTQEMAACGEPYNLQALATSKEEQGMSVEIATVEEVVDVYPGSDAAEKIRNFVKDRYEFHGTNYLLLAGDADMKTVGGETEEPLVPVRGLCGLVMGDRNIPSDLYYACLDGDFNDNGNDCWGEDDDGSDLLPDIWVGRAPVDSCLEVANFVRKTLDYQNAAGTWLTNVVMAGEWLWDDAGIYNFGKGFLEDIHYSSDTDGFSTLGFSENDFYNVITLYDADMEGSNCAWQPSACWAVEDILSLLNSDNHIINHLGHSANTYNMRLVIEQINAGLNNDNYFFEYTQGCYPGAFDNRLTEDTNDTVIGQDSFAEHLVLGEHGAFAAVMNTRYGLGWYSNYFHRYFWDAMFAGGVNTLGQMHAYSQVQMQPYAWSDEGVLWVYYTANLFGDPATSLHAQINTDQPLIGMPSAVKFKMVYNQAAPEDQSITIYNMGVSTLDWTIQVEPDATWLNVSSLTGTAPSQIDLSVAVEGLSPGVYTTNLIVTAPGAPNSPRTLLVELEISQYAENEIPHTFQIPIIDGIIDPHEYAAAKVVNLAYGSSTMYIMHNGQKLFFAINAGSDMDYDEYDAVDIHFDNNNDDSWPTTAADEGIFGIYSSGLDYFAPVFDSGYGFEVGQPEYYSEELEGLGVWDEHMVYEMAFDLTQGHLQLEPGDSFGMFLGVWDHVSAEEYEIVGWWPENIYDPADPAQLGDLVLGMPLDGLVATPRELSFEAIEGQEPLVPVAIEVINSRPDSVLEYLSFCGQSWIQLENVNGTTPGQIFVTIDPTDLQPGVYHGAINITTSGTANSTVIVPITLELAEKPPQISLDKSELVFELEQGGPLPAPQQITITNIGGGVLNWTTTNDSDWLALSSFSGVAPKEIDIVMYKTDLEEGVHQSSVSFSAPGCQPVELPVTCQVTPAPEEETSQEETIEEESPPEPDGGQADAGLDGGQTDTDPNEPGGCSCASSRTSSDSLLLLLIFGLVCLTRIRFQL
jgi:hypothetical protein